MPCWFCFDLFAPWPSDLWVQRVLLDLSDLHDAGVLDEAYLRRAWLTMMLVQVGNKQMPDSLREEVLRTLVAHTDLGENEQVSVEDVFGVISEAGTENKASQPNIARFLPGFPIAGKHWEFHLTDKDSNRPAPHGHFVEDQRVVLDPYTGDILDGHGKPLKSAKPRELRKLWEDEKFRRFAFRARKIMKEQQPWRRDALPTIPEF